MSPSSTGSRKEDQSSSQSVNTEKIEDPPGARVDKEVKEILFEGYFYDVTDWVQRHPGGKVIEFYTKCGEDASLAVRQFHARSEKKVLGILKSFSRRPAPSPNRVEQLDENTQRHHALTHDFTKLYKELETEGYFKPSTLHLSLRFLEVLLFGATAIFLSSRENLICRVLGHVSVMLFSTRCGFLQHEGGHHGLTGWPQLDRFLQALFFGVGLGLSSSWWSSQAILFLAIDTLLVVIFWKLYLHPRTAIKKRKYHELFFMSFHYVLLISIIGVWGYLAAAWLTSIYIFGTFSLSHTHLEVTDKPLHWVEYALCHTQDIDSSWWCDWWTGFLNCQIEHHLFPTMPEFRNRLVKDRVRALALKHNIPYNCMTYTEAVCKTFRNLSDVSNQLIQEHKSSIALKRDSVKGCQEKCL